MVALCLVVSVGSGGREARIASPRPVSQLRPVVVAPVGYTNCNRSPACDAVSVLTCKTVYSPFQINAHGFCVRSVVLFHVAVVSADTLPLYAAAHAIQLTSVTLCRWRTVSPVMNIPCVHPLSLVSLMSRCTVDVSLRTLCVMLGSPLLVVRLICNNSHTVRQNRQG